MDPSKKRHLLRCNQSNFISTCSSLRASCLEPFQKALVAVFFVLFSISCSTPKTTGPIAKGQADPTPVFQTNVQRDGVPILQGFTTNETAQFSVLHRSSLKPQFFVRSYEDLSNFRPKPLRILRTDMPHSDWTVSIVIVKALQPYKDYKLEVWTKNKFRKIDERSFRTLDLTHNSFSLLMVGCLKAGKYGQKKMWQQALSHKPDIILFNGDAVYASGTPGFDLSSSPESIWDDHVVARRSMDVFYIEDLIPSLALWDDGEYGQRDGHRDFRFKKASRVIFNAFFPQRPNGSQMIKGPGNAKLFRGFGVELFLMDARSFRSPKNELIDETQWGRDQEEWLLKHLGESQWPALVAQGDQFFGAYHPFESYEGHRPNNFKAMMEEIQRVNKPVAFLSGDRHLTELMALKPPEWPYPSFEFTSSALHAQTYPGSMRKYPNRRQVHGADGTRNYGLLRITSDYDKGARIDLQAWGPKRRKLFEQRFILKR